FSRVICSSEEYRWLLYAPPWIIQFSPAAEILERTASVTTVKAGLGATPVVPGSGSRLRSSEPPSHAATAMPSATPKSVRVVREESRIGPLLYRTRADSSRLGRGVAVRVAFHVRHQESRGSGSQVGCQGWTPDVPVRTRVAACSSPDVCGGVDAGAGCGPSRREAWRMPCNSIAPWYRGDVIHRSTPGEAGDASEECVGARRSRRVLRSFPGG